MTTKELISTKTFRIRDFLNDDELRVLRQQEARFYDTLPAYAQNAMLENIPENTKMINYVYESNFTEREYFDIKIRCIDAYLN